MGADAPVPRPRFEMIVGVHDLAEPPVASGDELTSWMPFSAVAPLLDRLAAETAARGVGFRVTSDDGFASDHALLLPWLAARGRVGTFFIATGFLDRPGRLSTAALRELAAAGMRIGVHGARHIDWSTVDEATFLADVTEGRTRLEDLLGTAVDTVAPPFGGYTGRVVARLFAAGFREILTTRPGLALAAEALKPRNMIKRLTLEAVDAVGRRRGGLRDAARCRLRRLRAVVEARTGATRTGAPGTGAA
jgi:peptidoglycan/xylan/chitin deacetylase (PgdA/CDA1 family)